MPLRPPFANSAEWEWESGESTDEERCVLAFFLIFLGGFSFFLPFFFFSVFLSLFLGGFLFLSFIFPSHPDFFDTRKLIVFFAFPIFCFCLVSAHSTRLALPRLTSTCDLRLDSTCPLDSPPRLKSTRLDLGHRRAISLFGRHIRYVTTQTTFSFSRPATGGAIDALRTGEIDSECATRRLSIWWLGVLVFFDTGLDSTCIPRHRRHTHYDYLCAHDATTTLCAPT
jgi:hypothetical protein